MNYMMIPLLRILDVLLQDKAIAEEQVRLVRRQQERIQKLRKVSSTQGHILNRYVGEERDPDLLPSQE